MSLARKCLSLVVSAGLFMTMGMPAFASLEGDDDDSGAKGLFFEQLDSPSKTLNTGVQYWIELNRSGQTTRVTNKHEFRSGDQIWFNVKSNIKGYAYILLTTGSRGEQSVLFPDPSVTETNRVTPGKVYRIPGKGALTFDENPGLEKVTLLISRHPIDAQAYLNKNTQNENATLIASAMTGAKDLVPAKVLVSIQPRTGPNLVAKKAPAVKTPVTKAKAHPKTQKPVIASNPKPKPTPKVKSKPEKVKVATKPKVTAKPVKKHKTLEGTVTVVSQAPENILHIDVDLHHI